MTLSVAERRILANQCLILAKLDVNNADHYERGAEAFESGYEGAYGQFMQVGDETMSQEACSEVHEILTMFQSLGNSYTALLDPTGLRQDDIIFHGFDANNEEQFGFYKWLKRNRQWNHINGGDDGNSHAPNMAAYRRMLIAWRASADPHSLSQDDIKRIAGATNAR
jgi:uncharacterized protein YfbU (UPF0304 family)